MLFKKFKKKGDHVENGNGKCTILMVDDDYGDYLLTAEALKECRFRCELDYLPNGDEFMDYLRHRAEHSEINNETNRLVILLDLNILGRNGFDILEEMNRDSELSRIPVVIFTTSRKKEDAVKSYRLGAAAYLVKPHNFESFVETLRVIGSYIQPDYPINSVKSFSANLEI